MSKLPSELKEEILTVLVDSYGDDDPAYQWTQLRNLSPFQRRRIENYFEKFWLPKVVCTFYANLWWSWDYTLESTDAQSCGGLATFKHTLDPGKPMNDSMKRAWTEKEYGEPTMILRCGEGFLGRGLKGGHIISDLKLPDLEVTDEGLTIRFEWRKTLNALFREEIMLGKLRNTFLENAIRDFSQLQEMDTQIDQPTLNQYLIKRLCLDIQMQSRSDVVRHRHARANTTVPVNKYLHWGLERPTGPTIQEVALQEESMVLCLPGWQTMDNETLLDLYAEEFGWSCCTTQQRTDDLDLQKARRDGWRPPGVFQRKRQRDRYDPLN